MTPFNPLPIEQLKAKMQKCLQKTYTVKVYPEDESPGAQPENIFDFEDGIRLIISREQLNGLEHIHFSGSIFPEIYKGKTDTQLLFSMLSKFGILFNSPYPVECELIAFSPKGIPHWKVKLNTILN